VNPSSADKVKNGSPGINLGSTKFIKSIKNNTIKNLFTVYLFSF